jgi:FtsH-binding integral membrane protein
MSQVPDPFNSYRQPDGFSGAYSPERATTDAVARFFNAVYAWMCAGLAVTALVIAQDFKVFA